MQRGLSKASGQTTQTISSPTPTSSSTQHGLDHSRPDASDARCFELDARPDDASLPFGDAQRAAPDGGLIESGAGRRAVDIKKLDETLRRLNARDIRPGNIQLQAKSPSGKKPAKDSIVAAASAVILAGQRVSEYEQALTPPMSGREHGTQPGAGLSPGSPSQGKQLADFPNGRTHLCGLIPWLFSVIFVC